MSSPSRLALERFGLHPVEIDIYISLLKLGSGTVSEIAKQTEQSRSLVYFHVRHLCERGLVAESRRKSVLRYLPKPAAEVTELLQSWVDDFREIVPSLDRLHTIQHETPGIEVIESKKGFYTIYEEISALPKGSVLRVLEGKTAMQGEMSLLTQREWQRFFSRMVERRISTKALFTRESLTILPDHLSPENIQLLHKRQWNVRTVHEGLLPFQNLLALYGNKVAFLFPETSLVMTIHHQAIAQSLQIMFDGLFTLGTERAKPLS